MRNFLYIFTLGLVAFGACNSPAPEELYDTTITGYLDNVAGKHITLAIQTPEGIFPIDTALVESDGYFVFTPELEENIQLYRLVIDVNQFITFAIKNGDHIHLEADGLNVAGYYIEGSEESELIAEVTRVITRHFYVLDSLRTEINHLSAAKNSKKLYAAFEAQKNEYSSYRTFIRNFLEKHPYSIASYSLVIQLDLYEDTDMYLLVQKELSNAHPNFKFIPTLNERIGILYLAQVGSEAPELAFPNPEGKIITLSSLRGKYVLIDFWAAWCRPCRAENPRNKKLYEKYKNQGFEIYGYSLDQTKEAWVKAIEEDQITWTQTSDLKGWKAAGAKEYGVDAIPATVLVDPNGIIIARNIVGQELESRLKDIFEK